MDDESRRIGARSKQFVIWAVAHVLAEQTKRPDSETLSKVLAAFGDTLKTKDVRGAQALASTYENLVRRAKDFSRTLAGGLSVDTPDVIRMLVNFQTHLPNATIVDDDDPPSSPIGSTEEFLEEVFARTADTQPRQDYFFDDIPSAPVDEKEPESELSAKTLKQLTALDAYAKYLARHERIPLDPYTRPDLGVTYFPTGRFDVDGVDWNYNGQVSGDMIRDCAEDKLLFVRGAPVKAILEFKNWRFTRTQKASGTIWIWAVTHEDGKQARFWFNNGDDQVRFYYTMTPKGVTQVNKKPAGKGGKKFIKVEERHITPLDLDR